MADVVIKNGSANGSEIIKVSIENERVNSCDKDLEDPDVSLTKTWGFNLEELFKLALKFYREQDGKAVNFSYQDKMKLLAYMKQISHGKCEPEKLRPVGVLDVIGRDRRLAWQNLGDMSSTEAKLNFINLVDQGCQLFKPYVQAHKTNLLEQERLQKEKENEEKAEAERLRLEEEKQKKNEEEKLKQEAQRRLIQEELNQQTFTQFKSYAEQQYPGNPEQQAVLVRQLQDQHYHLYMQKILHNDNKVGVETNPLGVPNLGNSTEESPSETQSEGDTETIPTMQPASMWTRKDVKEFKESIRKEGGDAIIKVGHGETVTVRVPTHEDGSCLFWEFATDNYDIGFGVYFEWGKSESNQVSVHVSESEDDEDLEDEEEDDDFMDEPRGDSEMGLHRLNNSRLLNNRPPMSIIIPVYRRDCQDEVYTGSHQYPGQGVYLLKFDNSYSLWRSKTLYYRIYYTH
ncbi:unnamed protein product [Bemisia tabaci]|uniref:Golgi resident protein GCP60 n=1 Tax=Bemisia tabaci TaxID=7038 RepID=A0A9P0ABP7_BEMTA|nr:PREDICTED: Golgi resident protein GCP60 [Bemisia tabaci]XP_018897224.1 PREDICTED: Golgi resident protein GCP60 [Bemisia tabaci]CAH0387219.1 unnamed protein product [Bemisia tabaci]